MSISVSYCVEQNRACVGWVEKYLKDCLRNLKDELSFSFGLLSFVCWGIVGIPQIITNFRRKSSHGLSLAFLLTWVVGDAFNLVGCLLEPATLPTQYYTALLYTTTTIILLLQTIYYDHIHRSGLKRQKNNAKQYLADEDQRKPLKYSNTISGDQKSGIQIPRTSTEANNAITTPKREFYYISTRSLAGSGTSPFQTYLRAAKSYPSTLMAIRRDSSSDDELSVCVHSKKSTTQPIPIRKLTQVNHEFIQRFPCAIKNIKAVTTKAGYGTFLAASLNLPPKSNAITQVYVGLADRKLLSHNSIGESNIIYGQWLGWMMAAIYMGGRLPQIWLNMKRGSVEGLNPLMFLFALIANATYVASILVRSTEWDKIKANMPWLLDAVVCVALDSFLILQYIYYKHFRKMTGQDHRDYYEEANKALESS